MSHFTRPQVALMMEEIGLVPVFNHRDRELTKKIVNACYQGGARLFEFTNRGEFAHEVFSDLSKYVIEHLPGMILGAGSVVETHSLFRLWPHRQT